MAVSIDVMNTTLADMYAKGGNLILVTASRKPLMKYLIDKKKVNKERVGGTYFERPFGYGSPAKGKKISTGNEIAALTRNSVTKNYRVESTRHLIPITIPNVDLKKNDGTQGVIKLIKQYPAASFAQYMEDWEFWLLTGAYHDPAVSVIDSPDFDGAATFNGNITHSDGNTGWFQALAPSAQTGNVQGVARNNTIQHISQFGAITSFAANGMVTLEAAYNLAAQRGDGQAPDFGFADGGSFSNLSANIRDNVRVVSTDERVDGPKSAEFLLYKAARVYDVGVNLDPTNASFTGTPCLSTSAITGGVIYFLNSEFIEVPYLEELDEAPEFKDMIADQDVVVAKCHNDWQPMVLRLNAHCLIAGGRIP